MKRAKATFGWEGEEKTSMTQLAVRQTWTTERRPMPDAITVTELVAWTWGNLTWTTARTTRAPSKLNGRKLWVSPSEASLSCCAVSEFRSLEDCFLSSPTLRVSFSVYFLRFRFRSNSSMRLTLMDEAPLLLGFTRIFFRTCAKINIDIIR
ncbi:hypothetical protein AVEN_217637-1 [Araneus ventricosus]|uniref:Uncharacterized protein n=1 Tax=Araneus ventricosus TaxID=182803 RepID=A0A4Y2WKK1_ARAVE|nr:hypothetical protein AVEN_217637-1 [Araneus ventricosus]